MEIKDCIEYHDKCDAECCKTVNFNVKMIPPKRGQIVRVKFDENISEDMKWYYELHGFRVSNKKVFIRLKGFTYENNMLSISSTCDYLINNKCKNHPDKKPLVCIDLDENTANKKEYFVTEKCRFHPKNRENFINTEGNISNERG